MMKRTTTLFTLGVITIGMFAFESITSSEVSMLELMSKHKFSGGAQTGLTGAPGEGSCVQCHSGNLQSGSGENNFVLLDGLTPVTTYIPGNTYTATLQLASNPDKKGFSSVALNASDLNAGSFAVITGGGTQDNMSNGRHYVTHTSSSNTNTTFAWTWDWTAPATDEGDVTFYIASNVANNNGSFSGDVIHLSEHVISINPSAGVSEEKEAFTVSAGYSPDNHSIALNFNTLAIGDMYLNLVDMNGRSVFTSQMGESELGQNKESIVLPAHLKNGIYAVHFFIDNRAAMAKICVQR